MPRSIVFGLLSEQEIDIDYQTNGNGSGPHQDQMDVYIHGEMILIKISVIPKKEVKRRRHLLGAIKLAQVSLGQVI